MAHFLPNYPASDRIYQRIIDTTQEGVWTMDADCLTTFVNNRFAEMLGFTTDEMIGRPVWDFLSPMAYERPRGEDHKRSENSQQHETVLLRKDGSPVDVMITTDPFIDEDGSYIGGVALVTDIGRQKAEREQMMITDRMASMGMLAAGVAHEINNPLAAILANLEYTMASIEASSETLKRDLREPLAESLEAAERVREIVKDLKIFSKSREDRLEPVDVRRSLDSILRLAWNEIRHRARLVKDYAEVPPVFAPESRLGQVFLNFILNAAQAMEVGNADENAIVVRTRHVNGDVLVEIIDTGSGIPAEVKEKLFTPFLTTKPSGTGLGLSICKRIVDELGGSIEIDSVPNRGTTVRVVFPAARDFSFAAPLSKSTVCRSSGKKFLVVDDEPVFGKTITRFLAAKNFVDTCFSSRDALRKIREGVRYDLIISDLMMPDQTGMDFHHELKGIDRDQATRMLFMTGGAFTPKALRFIDEMSERCLEKPFSTAKLQNVIDKMLAAG